ncbi:MAG TPA: hypothetical protein VIJ52_00675 [Pseudolabrys sp.]
MITNRAIPRAVLDKAIFEHRTLSANLAKEWAEFNREVNALDPLVLDVDDVFDRWRAELMKAQNEVDALGRDLRQFGVEIERKAIAPGPPTRQ